MPHRTSAYRVTSTAEDPAFLFSNGIWYGRALNEQNTNKYAYPHLELADPWINIRDRSEEWLIENVGGLPFDTNIQAYDFRPRKGSNFIDAGVVLPGINDGDDPTEYNHALSFPGQNRRYVGDAPDVGAYEYGDSVYWIPGYRYPHPSAPIPSDGAVTVPLDYSLVWNYPYREDYSGVMATVTVDGPGVSRTEAFEYPNNVLFETFKPGAIYDWSVSVDGVSGGEWTFQVDDHVYPLNDRSVDLNSEKSVLMPYQIGTLNVSNDHMAFLRFDIPNSINGDMAVNLNLVPESVTPLNGSVVVYRYDLQGWTEKLDDTNIGLMDYNLLTPVAEITGLEPNSPVSLNVSDLISGSGEISFALGVSNPTDVVSFYSREKLFKDGKYSPQMSVWPSLTFPGSPPVANSMTVSTDEDTSVTIGLSGSDADGYSLTFLLISSPQYGSLGTITSTGSTSATVLYTPAADFNGNDTFTYVVNDSHVDSPAATVTVDVGDTNDAPVSYSQEVSTSEGTPITVTLTGSDVDGDSLNWAISNVVGGTTVFLPHTMTATTLNVIFTPYTGFVGTGSISFYTSDAFLVSNTATISINVSAAATPTPTPSPTPTPVPPTPTLTPTPTPTSTPVPGAPTPTVTAVPTRTSTPVPGDTQTLPPTTTPDPILVGAPSMSGWGLGALVAGMLVVMAITLRRTLGRRPTGRM